MYVAYFCVCLLRGNRAIEKKLDLEDDDDADSAGRGSGLMAKNFSKKKGDPSSKKQAQTKPPPSKGVRRKTNND